MLPVADVSDREKLSSRSSLPMLPSPWLICRVSDSMFLSDASSALAVAGSFSSLPRVPRPCFRPSVKAPAEATKRFSSV
jgi:hypothetical protein